MSSVGSVGIGAITIPTFIYTLAKAYVAKERGIKEELREKYVKYVSGVMMIGLYESEFESDLVSSYIMKKLNEEEFGELDDPVLDIPPILAFIAKDMDRLHREMNAMMTISKNLASLYQKQHRDA